MSAIRMRRSAAGAARLLLSCLMACVVVAAEAATTEAVDPASVPTGPRVHRYFVGIDPDLRILKVRACFAGPPPEMLVVQSFDAPLAFVEGKVTVGAQALKPNGTEMRLKGVAENGCIDYTVNIAGRMQHDHSGNSSRRVGRDAFTEVGLWFWRPADVPVGTEIEVSFGLPEGIAVSTPWQPVAPTDGRPTYRVGHGAYDRPAAVAFGRFTERSVAVPGATLRLAILDGTPPADPDAMQRWITDAAHSVAAITGRFPVPNPQVLVMPGARASEPTPWAYVIRGGQAAAHFSVNQRRPLREFVEDWTAPHELSHLLLPYIDPNDAWLSEGLASYYQYIVRVRSGALTADDAWQRMHAAFRDAERWASHRGQSLRMASERMYRDGGYMRVYWQGAAVLLAADVELRRRSDNQQSLDTVLEAFGRCCLDPDREWTAREVFERFDEIAGGDAFRTLLETQVQAAGFAPLEPLYARLGLRPLGGKLQMLGDGELIAIRDAIMAPGSYRTPADLLTATR
jgi:hypothetical protein